MQYLLSNGEVTGYRHLEVTNEDLSNSNWRRRVLENHSPASGVKINKDSTPPYAIKTRPVQHRDKFTSLLPLFTSLLPLLTQIQYHDNYF